MKPLSETGLIPAPAVPFAPAAEQNSFQTGEPRTDPHRLSFDLLLVSQGNAELLGDQRLGGIRGSFPAPS